MGSAETRRVAQDSLGAAALTINIDAGCGKMTAEAELYFCSQRRHKGYDNVLATGQIRNT